MVFYKITPLIQITFPFQISDYLGIMKVILVSYSCIMKCFGAICKNNNFDTYFFQFVFQLGMLSTPRNALLTKIFVFWVLEVFQIIRKTGEFHHAHL